MRKVKKKEKRNKLKRKIKKYFFAKGKKNRNNEEKVNEKARK